jgi:hypothetical protein
VELNGQMYFFNILTPFSSSSSSSSGAPVHDEPWPLLLLPTIAKGFSTVKACYGVGLSTSHLTPNLEGQGIPLCLDHHL